MYWCVLDLTIYKNGLSFYQNLFSLNNIISSDMDNDAQEEYLLTTCLSRTLCPSVSNNESTSRRVPSLALMTPFPNPESVGFA